MLLPYRAKNPPESLPIATVLIIVANVVVFFLTQQGGQVTQAAVDQLALPGSSLDPLRILTSSFLHGSPIHLIGNMAFLYLFGFAVEGRLRTPKFVLMYAVSGLTSALLHHFTMGIANPDIPSLGASGAIMGVVGAAMYMFPFAEIDVVFWFSFRFGTFSWPMWGVGLFYLGFDLFWGLIKAHDGVAHFAHVGGAIGGALVCLALRMPRDSEFVSQAKSTLHETRDLSLLSRHELSELYKTQNDSPVLTLHWTLRSLRDDRLSQECCDAFFKHFPRMFAESDARAIYPALQGLHQRGLAKPRELFQMADALDKVGDYNAAMAMYQGVMRHESADLGDREAATYRMGMLYEAAYKNYPKAKECYDQVIQMSPMSPFADQAKTRLASVVPKLMIPPPPSNQPQTPYNY